MEHKFSDGVGQQQVVPEVLLQRARELRQCQTPAEVFLWDCLRNRQLLNVKFRRQHTLGRYIADFYCHGARLVVELDGAIHQGQREDDANRDQWMRAQGLTVLRFQNCEVFERPIWVLEKVAEAILASL